MRRAIIDADILLYRIGFAGQDYNHKVLVEDEVMKEFSSKKDANDFVSLIATDDIHPVIETEIKPKAHDDVEMMLEVMLKNILANSNSNSYMMYLSGPNNFRNDVATHLEYKGNRDPNSRPYHYQFIKDYILENHSSILSDNCEADDVCSINLWSEFKKSRETKRKSDCGAILCSIDKDLLGTPGYHYDIAKQKITWQTPSAANRHFAKQMLTGDRVDNIPGISYYSDKKKKVGPKTADSIITDNMRSTKKMYEAVSKVYQEWAGEDWKDKLQETGTLLYMQREPEQEFDVDKWSTGDYDK